MTHSLTLLSVVAQIFDRHPTLMKGGLRSPHENRSEYEEIDESDRWVRPRPGALLVAAALDDRRSQVRSCVTLAIRCCTVQRIDLLQHRDLDAAKGQSCHSNLLRYMRGCITAGSPRAHTC